jgi:BirA family biotin operon repressor/biotin-[acetyl-CoA-carboxylase] ligase
MNLSIAYRLLKLLSDGSIRSVAHLAGALCIEEHGVVEALAALRELGVPVATSGEDHIALDESIDLLDADTILAGMSPANRQRLAGLGIEPSLASTNSSLQDMVAESRHAQVLLAEHQSSGRGRRGKSWVSPFARNLYLSMGWRFQQPLSRLSCLPLVVALAIAEALSRAGLDGHQVKWPNDLLLEGRKLSGCLVEMQSDTAECCDAIIGIGINVNMPASGFTGAIDQPWTDLHSRLPGVSRSHLASLVLDALIEHLDRFAAQGFEPFRNRWRRLDCLQGQWVEVDRAGGRIRGRAAGIDDYGALLLQDGEQILKLHSGEVSLRKTPV